MARAMRGAAPLGMVLLLGTHWNPSPAQGPVGVGEASGSSIPGLQGPRFIPKTFFATTTHFNSDLLAELLDDLGMRAVRVEFMHRLLEPTPGQYAFSPGNPVIASADLGLARGLDQLALVNHPAEWLKVQGSADMYPSDERVAAFEEFVYRIASHYRGKITHWQAGNEPYMPVWKERYVTMLKALSRGVKRADPGNKVVLCGFSGGSYKQASREPEFLDIIYRHGGKDAFDVIASHPYTWPLMPEEGRFLETVRGMREVMEKNGDRKPLWVTEMGWSGVEPSMLGYLQRDFWHRHRSRSEEDQARALVRLYLVSATVPWIERVYFFHLHQEAKYTDTLENPDFYMGLFTPWLGGRVRPKDAYFALKTVVRMIGGATYRERVDLAPDLWALVFERGDEAIVALWCVEDDVVMTLGDSSVVKGVTSMVGTPVLISDRELSDAVLKDGNGKVIVREGRRIDWDGPNALRVSGRPIYLRVDMKDLSLLKTQIREAQIRRDGRASGR